MAENEKTETTPTADTAMGKRSYRIGTKIRTAAILVVASFLVGAVLTLADVDPLRLWQGIFSASYAFVERFFETGWDTVRTVLIYICAGAILVVPIWGVIKLFSIRK